MFTFIAAALVAGTSPEIPAQTSHCADFKAAPQIAGAKPAGVDDLLGLRDIGGIRDAEPPFTISPDGRLLAIALRWAVPATNSYCSVAAIVDAKSGKLLRTLELGDVVTLNRFDLAAFSDYGSGMLLTPILRWSPDGAWLAYLERRGGVVQLMRLRPSGVDRAKQVTSSEEDVRDFSWTQDGKDLLFSTRSGVGGARRQLVEEGLKGWRYDERWMPSWQSSPFPEPTPFQWFSINLESAVVRPVVRPDERQDTARHVVSAAGAIAEIVSQDQSMAIAPDQIVVATPNGGTFRCVDAACVNARTLWWSTDGKKLIVQSASGWADSFTRFWSWDISSGRKQILLEVEDRFAGCRPHQSNLLCAVESAGHPRHIEQINVRTGRRNLVFEPNPQWRSIQKGRVERLQWLNAEGTECFGYLVLPPTTSSARPKLPLVIVGYIAKGFLRGGEGDLFPVFPLASQGYAVLVYNRPPYPGYDRSVASQAEADRIARKDWRDSENNLSAILSAVDLLAARGTIDPGRVGISGFSDGVEKGSYALIHRGERFKAAAFSACCIDPDSAPLGPHLAKILLEIGFAPSDYKNGDEVKHYSIAANAHEISVPVLIQTGDREYLATLETEAALRRQGKTVALYIFPDEYHIFWQPAHRRAAYIRNIAWFDRYLLNRETKESADLLPRLEKRGNSSISIP